MIALVHDKLHEIAELCERFAVRKLDLFGSAATGEFNAETSDIDFIYEFAEREGLDRFHRYYDFTEALEELLQHKVDLNSEPSGRNPIYARSVNRSRETVYNVVAFVEEHGTKVTVLTRESPSRTELRDVAS